jgi:hypothetical protein
LLGCMPYFCVIQPIRLFFHFLATYRISCSTNYANFWYGYVVVFVLHKKFVIRMYYADLFGPPNDTNDFSFDYVLVGMASSSRSGSCGGGSNDEADWTSNRCFLPPWYERPKCTCHRPCTIDVWERGDTNRAGRRYFKCADTDPNFMVWW